MHSNSYTFSYFGTYVSPSATTMSAKEQYVSICRLFLIRCYLQDDKTASQSKQKGCHSQLGWGGMGDDYVWQAR